MLKDRKIPVHTIRDRIPREGGKMDSHSGDEHIFETVGNAV
jgi:hypothetical protein